MVGSDQNFKFLVERFDSLSSTSAYIKEEFKKQTPSSEYLCVLARTQTQGRGQAGHSWYSPSGNLYVSFGIKTNFPLCSNFSYLPLRVGRIVHDFLEEKFGINCYIKWPNDIYFACRKLCGILCESSVQGDHTGVIIGIGINIKNIDYSSSDTSFKVPPISLEEITGTDLDLDQISNEFIDYFSSGIKFSDLFESETSNSVKKEENDLSSLSLDQIPKRFGMEDHLYPASYPHYNTDSQEVLYDQAFDPDSYKTGIIPLYSKPVPFLGADIGNSRVKLFVIEDNNKVLFYDSFNLTQNEDIKNFGAFTNKIHTYLNSRYQNLGIHTNKFAAHSISVSDKNKELYLKNLASSFRDVPVKKRSVRVRYLYQNLGIDRACFMEGARSSYKESRLILISFGTATTIDVLDKGHHLGGWILPGIDSYFKSMSSCSNLEDLTSEYMDYIDKLAPQKHSDFSKEICLFLGNSTKACMIQGFSLSVLSLIKTISAMYTDEASIILSGGRASVIGTVLKKYGFTNLFKEDRSLTAIGIQTMVKGG